jgi:hypothetical protein
MTNHGCYAMQRPARAPVVLTPEQFMKAVAGMAAIPHHPGTQPTPALASLLADRQ